MKVLRIVVFYLSLITICTPAYSQFFRKKKPQIRQHHLNTHFVVGSDGQAHDLRPSFSRIKSKIKFPHKGDGTIFKNRKSTKIGLPVRPLGHYTEHVHPTPGLNHAGLMRIVTGKKGKAWFTRDHYKTFIPVRGRHAKY